MGFQKSKRKLLTPGIKEGASSGNPLGGVQSSELAPHVLQTAIVPLTAAQLKAMFAAPVQILAAPGAGSAIIPEEFVFEFNGTSTVYTGGGVVSVVFHGGSTSCHAGSIPASVVTAGAGQTLTQLGPPVASNGTTIPSNTGIDITNATGAFAAGTGTAKLFVKYRIITQ